MKKIKSLYVYYQNRKVGTLARYKEHLAFHWEESMRPRYMEMDPIQV